MERKDVLVVGYPRSGNTWLSRLLGEVLESPVMGWGSAKPLAEEGWERTGLYNVRQLHLHPGFTEGKEVIESAYGFNRTAWKDEIVIYVYRDPRDVAVSVYHYWDLSSIQSALTSMSEGLAPLAATGTWLDFHNDWEKISHSHLVKLSYESLLSDPQESMLSLVSRFGWLPEYSPMGRALHIQDCIEKQAFANTKKQIKEEGETTKRNYGVAIQLHHLYRGEQGRWKVEFSDQDVNTAKKLWGEKLIALGYEKDLEWTKE